jgi:hypothetical protein
MNPAGVRCVLAVPAMIDGAPGNRQRCKALCGRLTNRTPWGAAPRLVFETTPGPAGLTLRTTLRCALRYDFKCNFETNSEKRGPEEIRTPIFNSVYGYGVRSAGRLRDRQIIGSPTECCPRFLRLKAGDSS